MTREKLRKCLACGEIKNRERMIKITKDFSTGEVVLNPNSKTFGRSAYLCYNQSCIEQAFKKNKINRVLKMDSRIEKADILKLFQDLKMKGLLDG